VVSGLETVGKWRLHRGITMGGGESRYSLFQSDADGSWEARSRRSAGGSGSKGDFGTDSNEGNTSCGQGNRDLIHSGTQVLNQEKLNWSPEKTLRNT